MRVVFGLVAVVCLCAWAVMQSHTVAELNILVHCLRHSLNDGIMRVSHCDGWREARVSVLIWLCGQYCATLHVVWCLWIHCRV